MRDERRTGRCRNHHRAIKPEASLELFLELDAIGEPPGDPDLHHAVFARLGEKAVDPDAVDAKLLADLRLGEAGNEIEPCCAGGKLLFPIDLGRRETFHLGDESGRSASGASHIFHFANAELISVLESLGPAWSSSHRMSSGRSSTSIAKSARVSGNLAASMAPERMSASSTGAK